MQEKSFASQSFEGDDVLKLMMSYEILLRDLYELFSQKIPKEKDFWKRLSEEESKHAYWLEVLEMNMQKENITLNDDNRFNFALIKTSLDHVKESLDDFRQIEISFFDALSFASDIENSMIEKKFFEVFYGQSDDFDRVMKLLKEETEKHSQRIQEKLEEERQLELDDDGGESGIVNKIKKIFN